MHETTFEAASLEEQLEKHGTYASTTSGVSMEPLFRTRRDMVIIEKPKGELKKYDVALYRFVPGKYILHRVIKVKPNEYIIRGDNTYIKEHVSKDRVVGILTGFNRKGKSHSVTDRSYRIYSRVWNFIYPLRYAIRFLILLPKRAARKIYRILFMRNGKGKPTDKKS